MLVRDDEDLAVDQLAPVGREDDRTLGAHRAVANEPAQEAAAGRAEPVESTSGVQRLAHLREQISRLQLALDALPTKPLSRFDQLDARVRELTASRDEHHARLDCLAAPARRLGRTRDPDAAERTLLNTAIELDDRALADLAGERAQLQRELGDPDQVRSEREGIENALRAVRHDHNLVRDALAEQVVEQQPAWLTKALGERPNSARDRATWDTAATTITSFRLDHDIGDGHTPFGPEPSDPGQRHDWDQAAATLQRAQRQLGLDQHDRIDERDLGLG